jgi:5-oxopent-3-ene-1,2,5-tricarboxylate decarboxylase/2-hydroxyhepta-2,4-diene-1,7-dioate isomerase
MQTASTVPAWLFVRGRPQPCSGLVEPDTGRIVLDGARLAAAELDWDVPHLGCVYGSALNFRGVRAGLESTFSRPPHNLPPQAPVLYIKPRNTWLACGLPVRLPPDAAEVEVGATLGIVIGRDARDVSQSTALDHVAGYTLVNDLTIPHTSLFRPPLRWNARDGFCPIGPWVIRRDAVAGVDALGIRAYVNGAVRMRASTADLFRGIPELVAAVSEFMTLRAGDLLTVGVPAHAPRARAGDRVAVEIDGLGRLENELVAEAAA